MRATTSDPAEKEDGTPDAGPGKHADVADGVAVCVAVRVGVEVAEPVDVVDGVNEDVDEEEGVAAEARAKSTMHVRSASRVRSRGFVCT